MQPNKYIQEKLDNLGKLDRVSVEKGQLADYVTVKIMSKKFRKYAVDEAMKSHIEQVVKNAMAKNEPINFVWVFGGYKLWRIPTTPSVDWAELFSMIYFANWLKPITGAYEPGVIFDFYSDDVIVSRMNNILENDIQSYLKSFQELLTFFKSYLPANMSFTFHRVADQYGEGEFDKELTMNIEKLKHDLSGGLPQMDETRKALVELNVRLKPKQDQDPKWREKVLLIHDAYAMASKRRPYYRNEQKIMVLNTPVHGVIAVGTTKSSVAKFWCGMGVLEKRDETYYEKILTPKQMETTPIKMEKIKVKGLSGKNFEEIGILE